MSYILLTSLMLRLEILSRLDEIAQTGKCYDKEFRSLNHQLAIMKEAVAGLNPNSKLQDEARTVFDLSDLALSKVLQNSILEALRFERMDSRFDSVKQAHAETFKWLLKEDTSNALTKPTGNMNDPWFASMVDDLERDVPLRRKIRKDFTNWLSRGDGIFHISGKPGAGKSTLLKYLAGSEETKKYLDIWSGEQKLIFASFFFWKHGDKEQRSFNGLLRSLLFSVLEQQPDLTRIVFPTQWNALDGIPGKKSHFRWSEIQHAFKLLTQTPEIYGKHKFALLIDGLDEFEGHEDTLIKTLFEWAHSGSENVKICVSSRELPIFQQRFSECLKFRLHEVTYCDIFLLVYDTLRENEDVKSRSKPGEVASLGRMLVERAEGVFLWVRLALRMLEDGLLQDDTFEDLRRSIDVLPSKLEKLFRVIFDSIMTEPDPVKRRRAMRFLSLALDERRIYWCRDNLFLTHLSFIDDYDRDPDFGSHMNSKVRGNARDRGLRLSRCRKQVYGACRGLLSVSSRTSSYSDSDLYAVRKDTVALTHGSLVEFLKLPDIRVHIESQAQSFDRLRFYCQSLIAEVKVWELCPGKQSIICQVLRGRAEANFLNVEYNGLDPLPPRASSRGQDSIKGPTQSELLYGDGWLVHDLRRLMAVYDEFKRDSDIATLLTSILHLRKIVEADEKSIWEAKDPGAWYIIAWDRHSYSSLWGAIRLSPGAFCSLVPLENGLHEFWPTASPEDHLRVAVLHNISGKLTGWSDGTPHQRFLRCLAVCLAMGTSANSLMPSNRGRVNLSVWQNLVWDNIVACQPTAWFAPTWMLFLLHGADRNLTLTLEQTCNISTEDKSTRLLLITGYWGPQKYQVHSPFLVNDNEVDDGFLALVNRLNGSISLEEITYFWFAPHADMFRRIFEFHRSTSEISTGSLKDLRQELGFDPDCWHDQSWDEPQRLLLRFEGVTEILQLPDPSSSSEEEGCYGRDYRILS